MATCSHLAPNGEKSILYDNLFTKYGESVAHNAWTQIRSQEFMNKHYWYDWDIEDDPRLDKYAEPTMEWVEKELDLKAPEIKEEPVIPIIVPVNIENKLGKNKLSEEEMVARIKTVFDTAIANPDTTYTVPYEYTNDKVKLGLTQYTARELANLFDSMPIPLNIQFTPSFKALIKNSGRRIMAEYKDDAPIEFISRNDIRIVETSTQLLIPKVDGGFFSPVQQKEILDTIVSYTERLYRRDPDLKANALVKAIGLFKAKEKQLIKNGQTEKAKDFTSIYNHRVVLAEEAMRQLESLGLRTDTQTLYRVLDAVRNAVPLTEQEKSDFKAANPDIDLEQLDPYSGEFLEATGRIARDWSDNTFELDPKDTASARIKLFMGTLYQMDKGIYTEDKNGFDATTLGIHYELMEQDKNEGLRIAKALSRKPFWFHNEQDTQKLIGWLNANYPRLTQENFLGVGRTADYDAIFQETLNTLGDQLQGMTFDDAMAKLDVHYNPTIQHMAQELRKADQSMKNEFMTVMSKQYQPFVMALFNTTVDSNGKTQYELKPIGSNRNNQKDTLIKYWQEQQKLSDLTIISESGDRVLDVKRIRERWLPMLEYAKKVNDWSTPDNRQWFVNNMGNILRASGIGMTEEMMEDLFQNPKKWSRAESVIGLFSISKNGEPTGLLSKFIMRSAGQMIVGDDTDVEEAAKLSELHNPLYSDKNDMAGLAKLAVKYTPILYSSNHRNSEGKSIYDWGLNTKLSHGVRELKYNFDQFTAMLSKVDFAKNNYLIDILKDNPAQVDEIELAYFDGLKPEWGNRGTTRAAMSDREQLLTSILLFQNRGYGFNTKGKVNFMSLTHSDKTMTPIFRNIPRANTGRAGFIPSTLIGKMDAQLFKVFKSEYDRIVNQADIVFNSKNYNQGKKLFYLIPDFNFDEMKKMVKSGYLTEGEFNLIWPAGQRQLTKVISSDVELPVINKVLERFMSNLVSNTMTKWVENGITTVDSNTFDKKYVKKIMFLNELKSVTRQGRTIGESDKKIVDSTGRELGNQKINAMVVETAAKDFAVNSFLFNTTLSQLFFGDPAEAFKKPKGGTHDMALVQSTMAEYTKRLAKDIAPRADLYWGNKKTYNTLTLADVETKELYLADIASLKAAYADSTTTSTDAQELTTVQEKLDVLMASGKISSKNYDEMSDIIRRAGPGGYYEFTLPQHLEVIMQPDKPIYAGFRMPDRGTRLTDYVKSSSYALYPPFTAGRELDSLRILMENNNIARANFESAKKLGAPSKPLIVFSPDGKYIEPQVEDLQVASQTLSRSGFGIQQEVPYDEDKEAIKTLTQMNENITADISGIKDFQYQGTEMTGKELKAKKEEIRKKMLLENVKDFMAKLNVDDNGNIDTEKVLGYMAAEARKKGYTINELQSVLIRDKSGMPIISTMFNTAADKFESLLMGMVNKIAEVKMPGKSYVQASGTGIRLSEGADLSKIIRVGDWDGKPLKTLRKEDGKMKPAQVILPFNFFDNAGNKLQLKDFVIDGKLDMTRIPQELLELIGARIPNQGHSSMLPLEIVGFTPDEMGDIVFVPAAIVKQMGADFDVDKLYTYKRAYKYDPLTTIFSSEDGLQKDYFDVHWSVLTHKSMHETILKQLDKEDLKDESQLLKRPTGEYFNFYDPMSQLEDFQRGKEAKRLVATSSWAVKFNARIQDKKLRYGVMEFDKNGPTGNMIPKYIQIRDASFGTRELGLLSGTGMSRYFKDDWASESNGEKRTKGDNHVMVQSEAVDNTKFRTLDNLNITPDTYKAVQAMIQLQTDDGWAPNSKYWTRLLTQPIIWEYTKMMKQGNDSLSEQYDPNLHDTVIAQLSEKYMRGEFTMEDVNQIIFEPELLLKAQKMEGEEFYKHQMAALSLFNELYKIGQRMFELESQFNQDVGGAGPNLFAALDKQENMENLRNAPIMGAEGLFSIDGKLTEVGTTFDALINTGVDVVKQVFPYHALKPILGQIKAHTGKASMSLDTQKTILRAFRSYTYTMGNFFWDGAQNMRVRLMYGEESLAKRMVNAQRTWGKDNPMLARLKSVIGTNTADPDFITYVAASKTSTIDKQNMTNGWLYMLMSENEEQRQLGEDLLRYAYLTGGVQDANSFVEFMPVAYLAGTEFSDHLRGMEETLKEDGEIEDDGFVIQFFQHNPQQAPQVYKKQFGALIGNREYPEAFPVPKGVESSFMSYRSKADGKWILYKMNEAGTFYVRIDTLGNKYSDEYNGAAGNGQDSVFSENRSMVERLPSLDGIDGIESLKNNSFVAGDYNKGVSYFEQIGIKTGGEQEIFNGLASIATNKEIPQYLRTVSKLLVTTKNSFAALEAKKIDSQGFKPIKLDWENRSGYAGQSNFHNEIYLNNADVSSLEEATETFLHEMLHNRLQWIVVAAGYDSRVGNNFSDFIGKYRKANPKMVDKLTKLDVIRYDALNRYRNSMAEVDYQQLVADVEAGKIQSEEHKLYYALSSLQEFVAHVPTSSSVAGYLNTLTSPRGESFLNQVWTLFAEMIEALGEAFGFKVRDNSLLKEALIHTMSLVNYDNNQSMDITAAITAGTEIRVATEKQASDVSNLINNVYARDTQVKNTEVDWTVLTNHSRINTVGGQRGKVIAELYKERDAISDALQRTKKEARVPLRSKFREVNEQIKLLHQSKDIAKIAEVGKRQLQWVDEVLRSSHPTTIDVNLAQQVTNLWGSLIDILYGDLKSVDVNKDFADIQNAAQAKRIELTNTKAWEALTSTMAVQNIKLSPLDKTEKLTDIDGISANVLALTRAKPMLVQGTAVIGTKAANDRDEAYFRNSQRLTKLGKKLEATGLTPQMMLQLDETGTSWGLVNRLSAKWNQVMTDDRNKLSDSINAIDRSQGLTDDQRRTRKHDAWNKYWEGLKKVATFVDSRIFFDVKTGAKNSGPEFDKAFNKLADEVGNRDYAEELIKDAQQKYEDYITEREAMSDHIDNTIQLTEEEKDGKTVKEQEELLEKLQKDAMAAWLKYNSPIEFLSSLNNNKDINYNSDGDQWVIMAPREGNSDFYDERYQKIESDPKMREAYNEYKSILKEMISYLPVEIQRNLPDNFFPIVPQDTVGWLANIYNKIRNWDAEILNTLTATDAEEASRLRPDKIPVMYTYATNLTKDVGNRSTDLTRVLEVFSMMALQHKYMGQVLDTINVAESVLKEVNRKRMNGEAEGKPLRHVIDALKYFKDALVFKKPKELQGKVDSPIYSINPATQHKITEDIKALTKEKKELKEAMDEKMIEGDFEHDKEEKRIEQIDKKLTEYQQMARNIYGSKFADALVSINQMKALAFNPFSAVSNYTFAEISLMVHANGKMDFTGKNLREATGIMAHAMKRYWSFGSAADSTANKIHGLMARTGIMGDVVDTDYGQGVAKRKTRTGRVMDPFNWQRSGDYFTKGKLMVAMMKKQTVEVTENGEVKTITLWDAFDGNGEWNVEKYGESPDWDTLNGGEKFSQFRDRMRKVSMIVFGNQDKNSPIMAKKNWLWRLAGQFRLSWFPEGIASRFKPSYMDAQLGREAKGRWRSYSDIGFLTSGLILARQTLAVLPGVKKDVFNGLQDRKGNLISESPVDMENMRKNFAGMAFTVSITAAMLLLRGMGKDDEDKDSKHKRQLLINMLIRNHQDLMLYSSPAVFNTISGNFLPASQVIVDYWNAMKATAHYVFGDTSKDRHAFDSWLKKITRAGLPHPSATLYNKFETMMTRDLDKINR